MFWLKSSHYVITWVKSIKKINLTAIFFFSFLLPYDKGRCSAKDHIVLLLVGKCILNKFFFSPKNLSHIFWCSVPEIILWFRQTIFTLFKDAGATHAALEILITQDRLQFF